MKINFHMPFIRSPLSVLSKEVSMQVSKSILILLCAVFLAGCSASIDPNLSDEVAKQIVHNEYRYATFGFWVGVGLILLGVILVVFGVAGSTSFVATFTGGTISVADAPFGVALIVSGIVLIYITRAQIKSPSKEK